MDEERHQLRRALGLLIGSLEARQQDGARAVWLTPKGRKDLAALAAIDWSAAPAPAVSGSAAAGVRTAAPGLPLPAPAREPHSGGSAPRVREEPDATDRVALRPEGASPEEQLAWLRRKAADWPPARRLASLRDTMVFAVGNPRADLVLVGEAPGAEEERRGEPFVGPAGEVLTRILRAMGLTRDEVYITNIAKFRPAMPEPQGEMNRPPSPEEMAACVAFVRAEIEVIRPKVIVALGGTACKGLLGLEDPVARLRGRFREFHGVPVMVTYHPAYLLRNGAVGEKRKVWEDMLLVMEKLGLPISEKQRGYFT